MIRDLSESLEQLLTTEIQGIQVEFVRPSEPYNPAQGLTTVNLFLYDIRENLDLRNNQPAITRQGNQATTTPPPLRVACSYLVTAWPSGNTDLEFREHRLLSQVLGTLARFPSVPPQFLQGSLMGQQPPLPAMVASGDGLQNPAEFWSAVGNRLKASFVLTVTIAMDIHPARQDPVVITAETGVSAAREGPTGLEAIPGTREAFFRIAGTLTDNTAAPVKNASVLLVQTGLTAETDVSGEFDLGTVPAGNYILRVTSGQVTQDFNVTVPAPQGADYDLQLP